MEKRKYIYLDYILENENAGYFDKMKKDVVSNVLMKIKPIIKFRSLKQDN